jgi:hypothetical protein
MRRTEGLPKSEKLRIGTRAVRGTTNTSSLCARMRRVECIIRFFVASAFICLSAAEMKTSTGAPRFDLLLQRARTGEVETHRCAGRDFE